MMAFYVALTPLTPKRVFSIASLLASICFIVFAFASRPVAAADEEAEPDWKVFDEDRDPSSMPVVKAMLSLARVGAADIVYDLGSGDGRITIAANKIYGVKSVGIEFNPALVQRSRINAARQKASVTFIEGDVFATDFSEATVVLLALWESINIRLSHRLLQMPAGTRIVSNEHEMGEWKPDRTILVESGTSWGVRPVHLWIVPSRIAGDWRFASGSDQKRLTLTQKFQTFAHEGENSQVRNGRIAGTAVSFELRSGGQWRRMTGRVYGGKMQGQGWSAVKEE